MNGSGSPGISPHPTATTAHGCGCLAAPDRNDGPWVWLFLMELGRLAWS